MPAPDVLDLTTAAPLADLTAAREALATRVLDPATRDAYLDHLDMLESAARRLCATL